MRILDLKAVNLGLAIESMDLTRSLSYICPIPGKLLEACYHVTFYKEELPYWTFLSLTMKLSLLFRRLLGSGES